MMTNDMILAELALRGWCLSGMYLVKHLNHEHHVYLTPVMARPAEYRAKWPVSDGAANDEPNDEALRRMHDIVSRYERGDYEPRQDGSTPNVARVDSFNAPERLGIQNDRPEYGGTSYRARHFSRRQRR